MEEEKTYFKEGDIIISSARFIFGNKTYSAQNVTSVSWKETKGSNKAGKVFIIIGGIILAISLLLMAVNSNHIGFSDSGIGKGSGPFSTLATIGAGLLIAGIINLITRKTQYVVVLTSSAAEQTPLIGKNLDQIVRIVSAINEAIIESHKKIDNLPKINTPSSDKIDKLEKLARLKSEGILTEEEFNEQKKKLLNS